MKDFLRDLIDQGWTLLGMFVAWICLDGSTKNIVGWSTLAMAAIWMSTFWMRRD